MALPYKHGKESIIFHYFEFHKDDSERRVTNPGISQLQETAKIYSEEEFLKLTPRTIVLGLEHYKEVRNVIFYLLLITYFLLINRKNSLFVVMSKLTRV